MKNNHLTLEDRKKIQEGLEKELSSVKGDVCQRGRCQRGRCLNGNKIFIIVDKI